MKQQVAKQIAILSGGRSLHDKFIRTDSTGNTHQRVGRSICSE